MQPVKVKPVKYFVGALFSSEELLMKACNNLEGKFSAIDLVSEDFLFDVTDYYNSEMGTPIHRRIFTFTDLENPNFLAETKLITNDIEDLVKIDGQRKVNLDVGYIDYDKVVLASAKYCIHKIYLDKGIYADLALHYEKGTFHPYPWAFMDFKLPRYYNFFFKARMRYKQQVKECHT